MAKVSPAQDRTEPVLDLAACIDVEAADAFALWRASPGSRGSMLYRKEPCIFGATNERSSAGGLVAGGSADAPAASGAAAVLSHPAVVWMGGAGLLASGITALWMFIKSVA